MTVRGTLARAGVLTALTASCVFAQSLYRNPSYAPTELDPRAKPPLLKEVGIEERMGAQVNLDLEFLAEDGSPVKLGQFFKQGRPVILYFYPKDDTPGCTKEACAFQDNLPKFGKSTAAVLGVSVLDEASKAKFAGKYSLTFPLLADPDHAVIDKYGAWQEKSMYGKKYMGVARITYLIGPDGKVVKRWDAVKVDGHAEEVLAEIAKT